jgi:hypothetical protein
MPVMEMRRGDRVHLFKRIDLMFDIQVNGFVAPTSDPQNTGMNAAGGESDDVSNAAVVGAHLQELQKARVMALVEHPN